MKAPYARLRSSTEVLCFSVLEALPAWVVSDAESVRREVADWARMTPEERWQLAALCARDAMWAVHASGRAEQILALVDPLPESTRIALARLRKEEGWGEEP